MTRYVARVRKAAEGEAFQKIKDHVDRVVPDDPNHPGSGELINAILVLMLEGVRHHAGWPVIIHWQAEGAVDVDGSHGLTVAWPLIFILRPGHQSGSSLTLCSMGGFIRGLAIIHIGPMLEKIDLGGMWISAPPRKPNFGEEGGTEAMSIFCKCIKEGEK